jgi:hypothetical protein
MIDSEDGYMFWKRVDTMRDSDKSLKEVITNAGLNYELVKVQRSLNRIPKASDVCRIATALQVPTEWLVIGETIDSIDNMRVVKTGETMRVLKITQKLADSNPQLLTAVEMVLEMRA